jgi:hypothetical protein
MRKVKLFQVLFLAATIASLLAAAKGVGHGGYYGFSGGVS